MDDDLANLLIMPPQRNLLGVYENEFAHDRVAPVVVRTHADRCPKGRIFGKPL